VGNREHQLGLHKGQHLNSQKQERAKESLLIAGVGGYS
jgi:hypothetical protein